MEFGERLGERSDFDRGMTPRVSLDLAIIVKALEMEFDVEVGSDCEKCATKLCHEKEKEIRSQELASSTRGALVHPSNEAATEEKVND